MVGKKKKKGENTFPLLYDTSSRHIFHSSTDAIVHRTTAKMFFFFSQFFFLLLFHVPNWEDSLFTEQLAYVLKWSWWCRFRNPSDDLTPKSPLPASLPLKKKQKQKKTKKRKPYVVVIRRRCQVKHLGKITATLTTGVSRSIGRNVARKCSQPNRRNVSPRRHDFPNLILIDDDTFSIGSFIYLFIFENVFPRLSSSWQKQAIGKFQWTPQFSLQIRTEYVQHKSSRWTVSWN